MAITPAPRALHSPPQHSSPDSPAMPPTSRPSTGWLCFCLAAWLLLIPSLPAADAPVRLMLQPVPALREAPKSQSVDARRARALALYLDERLAEAPGVMLMDEGRSANVFFELRQVRQLPESDWYAALDRLQLDAIIALSPLGAEGEDGRLLVITADQVHTRALDGDSDATAIREAAAWLAETLDLPAADRAPLLDARLPDQGLATLYLSRRVSTPWIINSGETRLELIRPWLRAADTDPRIAAFFIDAGQTAHDDRRKLENPRQLPDMLRNPYKTALSYPFSRDGAMRYPHAAFLPELREWAAPLGRDAADDLLDVALGEDENEFDLADGGANKKKPLPRELQLNALRILGHDAKSRELIDQLTRHAKLDVREAATEALGLNDDAEAKKRLTQLAKSDDPSVALLAIAALRQAEAAYDAAVALRVGQATLAHPRYSRLAHQLTIAHAGASELDWLRAQTIHTHGPIRAAATSRLAELDALSGDALMAALRDPAVGVVAAGLNSLRDAEIPADPALRAQLLALANSPQPSLADRATGLVRRFAGDDPGIDLRIGSLYGRLRAIERLAAADSAEARAALAGVITLDQNPQVAAAAFNALAAQDPAAGRSAMAAVIESPSTYLQVHLAAWLAAHAEPADEAAIQTLEKHADPAVAMLASRALGRIGQANVAIPAPANPVRGFGICESGEYAIDSPITWYYLLNPTPEKAEQMRQLSAAGRALIGRANNAPNHPGHVLFHPQTQHNWWSRLVNELTPMPWLDGIVLGEESMYFKPWQLWDMAWWDFCRDAGIDPASIEGDKEKLTGPQKQAFRHWEEARCIEGFNRMYAFSKLYFGALRPGFTIATFMPDQNGPSSADASWQFDMGAAYYYEAGNRVRYNMIRRQKTIWPERPVMWLVNGSAGTAGPNFGRELLKYNAPMPTEATASPNMRAYSDAVTARIAGAEVGYFSVWLAANMRQSGQMAVGTWLHLQDIAPDSPVMKKAQATAFQGVEEFLRAEADTGRLKDDMNARIDDDGDATGLTLDAPGSDADPTIKKLRQLEDRWRNGMLMEQDLLYRVARVVADVPVATERPPVLFVGPHKKGQPEYDLAHHYDIVEQLNKLADLDLSGYAVIAILGQGETRLRDETIAAISDWLAGGNRVLYVRGGLATDNSMEAGTPTDMDGTLQRDWPWEGQATKALADGLTQVDGLPVILADAPSPAATLAPMINSALQNVGAAYSFTAPYGILRLERGDTVISATAGKVTPVAPQPGVEILSGQVDPTIGPGRMAAITQPADAAAKAKGADE